MLVVAIADICHDAALSYLAQQMRARATREAQRVRAWRRYAAVALRDSAYERFRHECYTHAHEAITQRVPSRLRYARARDDCVRELSRMKCAAMRVMLRGEARARAAMLKR